VLDAFLPDTGDLLASFLSQPSSHRASVFRVGHALDQAVALQVVDQPCDVAGRGVEGQGDVAERDVALPHQAKQDAKAPGAEPVVLRPPLLEEAEGAGGELERGQGLDCPRVDLQWIKKLAETLQVEAAVFVPGDARDLFKLQIRSIHIEALHYYQIQDLVASYSPEPVIVDAHLDISWNAISAGRGFLGPPAPGYLISRSSLLAAEVGLVFATLYTAPARARRPMRSRFVYENAHEANLMATAEVNYYRSSGLELIGDQEALAAYARGWRKGKLAAVVLMEGADPVETPAQLSAWTDRGVRIIGPAWGATRYSGGTGAPGGLTELGHQLLKAMRRRKVILDLSHMADQAVADAFAVWRGPLMASHSNARSIVPGDRQVTDQTVAEIAGRGGVVGVSFYQKHLRSSGRATLDDVVKHIVHHAGAAGGPEHVGLGTDLDGGFDAKQAPIESLAKLKELPARLRLHFNRAQVDGIMGNNWLEFLSRSLPPPSSRS
jgi:membrane dipeptidase